MKVFITGATGYIGWSVANTFRNAGYQVLGLTRSREKASVLEKNEIIPVIGNIHEPDRLRDIADRNDIIIHSAIDYQHDTAESDEQIIDLFIDSAKFSSPTRTLIYTSGVWVLGDRGGQILNEDSPIAPIEEVSWRPKVEQTVLKAEHIRGIVIRPAVVYGKSGGMTGAWFKGATNGSVVQVVGDGNNHWAMVHVDDLAQAYLLAARSKLSGEVFDIVDRTQNTVLEMASAAAQTAGNIHQIEFIPFDDAKNEMGAAYAEALALDQIIDASKAHRMLNWQPKHKGFIPEVDTYFRAWKAHQS